MAGRQYAVGQTTHEDSLVGYVPEITVYGAGSSEIVPHQQLTGKRLEALSSFSVADAVRYFSGVQIKDYGGIGGLKTIDVRSMGSNHMGVFYDGIQLGNAQNGQVDLGRFSLDNIEEISLYNGQKSDIFQSAKDFGSAGTIYIRIRRPHFEPQHDTNMRVAMKTGSFGLVDPSLLWEQRWSDRVTSSVSTEYINATGKYKFRYRRVYEDGNIAWDTVATRQNGDIESFRLEGSVFGDMDRGMWNAKVYYYDSERGIPGAIVNNVWKHSQRQWDSNFFIQGGVKQQVNDTYQYQIKAKYARDYMHYLNPDTTLMYIDNHFTQHEWYVTASHLFSLTRDFEISLSTDYQLNTLDANLVNFVNPQRNTLLWATAATYQYGVFRTMLSLLGTHVWDDIHRNPSGQPSGKTSSTNRLTPALFISCKVSPDLSMRAFYKQIFRMPTFNDLYYTDIGNIYLRPEYATQYNIGMLYNHRFHPHSILQTIELKADAYYNHVDDKIVAIPKGSGQYRWMMMNIGRVKIRGLELSAQTIARIAGDLMINTGMSYTCQRAQDYTDPTDNTPPAGTYKGQIAYIPRHSGSLTVNLVYGRWSLNYAFVYVGERYHNSSNILANHEQPWYTSDVGITRDMNVGGNKLRLAVECNNMFNQQYDVVLNYPMPGRNWKYAVKWEF